MRLRTIVGPSMDAALEQVQKELGPNAMVLETRTGAGGAEVVAADVEREEPAEGLMRLRAEIALLRRELLEARPAAPAPVAAAAEAARPAVHPRLALVEQRLRTMAVDRRLIQRVLTMLAEAKSRDTAPIDPRTSDACLNSVAGLLPGVGPAGRTAARAYAFVGPAGAGKTTTIAKLAELSRAEGDRSLAILSLDSERPGKTELLETTCARLGLGFAVARGGDDFGPAIDRIRDRRTVLIDTGGLGPREGAAIEVLRERLHHPGQVAVHLVVPANMEPLALRAAAELFRPLGPAAIVFTKVDETRVLGELINLPCALDLPVAAIGHGPSPVRDLAPATRRLVAELVLGRRSSDLR